MFNHHLLFASGRTWTNTGNNLKKYSEIRIIKAARGEDESSGSPTDLTRRGCVVEAFMELENPREEAGLELGFSFHL